MRFLSTTLSIDGVSSVRSTLANRPESWRGRLRRFVSSPNFDAFVGSVVLVNTVTIGMEQTARIENGQITALDFYAVLEHVFLCIYIAELFFRFIGFGLLCLKDSWVKFDLALVVMAIVSEVIGQALGQQDDLQALEVISMARLARLARAVRLFRQFNDLWLMVRMLLACGRTLFFAMLLLLFMLYIFGVLGVEMIAFKQMKSDDLDPHLEQIIQTYFGSLPKAMLTVVQFVCLDSNAVIYRPLIEHDSTLVFYFMSIILVVAIVLMNIFTAVIVNGSLEQAKQDQEDKQVREAARRKAMMKSLRQMFLRLDEDGSGSIDRDEIKMASLEDERLLSEFMNSADPLEIFDALDIDGGGSLDIEEFCEGVYQSVVSKKPIEMKRMDKRLEITYKHVREVHDTINAISVKLGLNPHGGQGSRTSVGSPRHLQPRDPPAQAAAIMPSSPQQGVDSRSILCNGEAGKDLYGSVIGTIFQESSIERICQQVQLDGGGGEGGIPTIVDDRANVDLGDVPAVSVELREPGVDRVKTFLEDVSADTLERLELGTDSTKDSLIPKCRDPGADQAKDTFVESMADNLELRELGSRFALEESPLVPPSQTMPRSMSRSKFEGLTARHVDPALLPSPDDVGAVGFDLAPYRL